jgi:hypothetical protein
MERCLYHYKVVGEDAQGSCEDAICFKSYFVSRNSWIPKCNFHMLCMITSFTLVFKNANGPNLSHGLNNYKYIVSNC